MGKLIVESSLMRYTQNLRRELLWIEKHRKK